MFEITTKITKDNFKIVKFSGQGANCEYIDKKSGVITKVFIYCKEEQLRANADWRASVVFYTGEYDIFGRYNTTKKKTYLDL